LYQVRAIVGHARDQIGRLIVKLLYKGYTDKEYGWEVAIGENVPHHMFDRYWRKVKGEQVSDSEEESDEESDEEQHRVVKRRRIVYRATGERIGRSGTGTSRDK